MRDLLRLGGARTEPQVVAAFQGAPEDGIAGELERLAGLGLVVSWEARGERWWQWV